MERKVPPRCVFRAKPARDSEAKAATDSEVKAATRSEAKAAGLAPLSETRFGGSLTELGTGHFFSLAELNEAIRELLVRGPRPAGSGESAGRQRQTAEGAS